MPELEADLMLRGRLAFLLLPCLALGQSLAQDSTLTLNRPLADTTVQEDLPLRLYIRDVFLDPRGGTVTYTAKTTVNTGAAVITGDTLVFTPPAEFSGSSHVTLFGEAGSSRLNFTSFYIQVIAVNDPPYFTGPVPEIAFHNNDSFSIDLGGKIRDAEPFNSSSFTLEFDSLPGFAIRATNQEISGRALSVIARSTLKVRAVDRDRGVSKNLEISLFPNAPIRGDSIPVTQAFRPKEFRSMHVFSPKGPGFKVITANSAHLISDAYLPDGSKSEASRINTFAPFDSIQPPRIFDIGGKYLVGVTRYMQGRSKSATYLMDGNFSILKAIQPEGSEHHWIKAVDTASQRIYLQRTIFPATGTSSVLLEAYDFNLNPIAAPAFAQDLIGNPQPTLLFEKGRTLVVKPQSGVHPLKILIDAYGADGAKESAHELLIDHVPAEDSLKPEIKTYRLVPYRGGYALFAGIQDYQPLQSGGKMYLFIHYRSILQKFGPDFQATTKSLKWVRNASDEIYPVESFELGGGHMLVSSGDNHSINREFRQYLHFFDADMNPLGQPELRILPMDKHVNPAGYARLNDQYYLEVLQFNDGRKIAVKHAVGFGPVPIALRRSAHGVGKSARGFAGGAFLLHPEAAEEWHAVDVLGKKHGRILK